jgi:glutathione S-transferase
MALIFYERVGHDGRRPSPFSWRIRYALAHKGLDFEVRPVRFADVGTIRALSGQHLTPILSYGDHVVHETWDIACYLEDQFPDRPSLFGGAIGRGMARRIIDAKKLHGAFLPGSSSGLSVTGITVPTESRRAAAGRPRIATWPSRPAGAAG